jgi:hypothetical protein
MTSIVIIIAVILIYLGGMGLVTKIMFLKVPLKLDGKLQPYINSIVLGGAYIYLLAH